MPSIFGLASLGIGILLVIKCANLPVMVLATLLGALIGEFCYLEKGINSAVSKAKNLITRPGKAKHGNHESFIQNYVAIIILFCASGTGIFGSMQEGMTGDPSILIAKAFLDFFTATIFATTRYSRGSDLRADAADPAGAGNLRDANPAADHAGDDGRFYRRGRFAAAGNRVAHLRD
jgi:uncharacterized membrane protein YqgA involved in biofilm formation